MKTILYEPKSTILRRGTYIADRDVKTIEDPRRIKFEPAKRMDPTTWETHIIKAGDPILITGRFVLRNKVWYTIKNKGAERPQVINETNLAGAKIKKRRTRWI